MSGAEAGTGVPGSAGGRVAGPSLGAVLAVTALLVLSGCGPSGRVLTPGPHPPAPRLPSIPEANGPLELRVSYPRDSLMLGTRGTTFIFGSAGNRRARVWVNGQEVEVEANGAFLAYLPVPEDGVYRLRATMEGFQEQRLHVPVLLPPAPPEVRDSTFIVAESVYPTGGWVAQPGERIEVGFTGTRGGVAWLELGDVERVPLVPMLPAAGGVRDFEVAPSRGEVGGGRGLTTYRGFFNARRLVTTDTAVRWPTLTGELWTGAGSPLDSIGYTAVSDARLVLTAFGDTVRVPLPLNLLMADPDRPRTGVGRDLDPPERNGDARVVARPGPGGGPYHYVWANGVELELTGERDGAYRVRLTPELSAWTPAADIQLLMPAVPPPESRVAAVRLDPQPEHLDLQIALDRRLPYRVEETEGGVAVVVYGAVSRVNFLQHGRVDPYVHRAEWSQPTDRVFRVDLRLTGPLWGYDTFWGAGDDLVVRLNRPPAIDREAPLRGLVIGLDPGHGGTDTLTMGPTGFTEAEANLGIALALRTRLERRGARVVMSRLANTTESLVQRTRLARAEDVDVWVSIHNNAFPDGVEPWSNNGTSVYYNHPRAAGLAWSVQRALLQELGLRDLGIGRADLHQARFTWAPAILTENMFMMIPSHEAFLKTERGQRRVAEAHLRGLEAWLREVAGPPEE